ncbi:MAG: type II toxin-antitoxin system VapC family toxin [Promethearchaeota archaeon]
MRSNFNLIVIDSNFILLPFQFRVDYLNEIRMKLDGKLKFIIFRQILKELDAKKKRESKATKFQRQLKSGLLYLESNKENFSIEFIDKFKENNETTDDFLIRKLITLKEESRNIFLATNDSELRKRVRDLGLSTIYLRQKKYISIERA